MEAIPTPKYRPAKQLPDEVRTHCQIFLDELLYTNALTLLNDLVTSGASHPDAHSIPCFAPSPFHIELVSTLLIHPRYTNQASPTDHSNLASKSITFLRNTLKILGPINANLGEAFAFTPMTAAGLGGRSTRRSYNSLKLEDISSGSDTDEPTKGVIANKGRLRRSAKDFWHVLGWGLNCSIRYPARWKYWKVWLYYMLDVLEADWEERQLQDQDGNGEGMPMSEKALIVRYIRDADGGGAGLKRIVRSVFVDGGPDSLRDFPEVFQNETMKLKVEDRDGKKRKREDSNVAVTFGDYDEDEGDSLAANLEDISSKKSEDDDVESWLGDKESMILRQRVITLLSAVIDALPNVSDIWDLYDHICTFIKPIPVPAFSLFFSASNSSHVPVIVFVSLTQMLIGRFLPNTAPLAEGGSDGFTQDDLECCYFPFAANTSSVADNAKISILMENLFRRYIKERGCEYTEELRRAVEKGIEARESKFKGTRKKTARNTEHVDDENMVWLRGSSQRLRSLLAFARRCSDSR